MSTKSTTTTTDASAEDRRRVQRSDNDDRRGSGSGATTGLVGWQQQRSVDFLSFQVSNSNTVLSLSSRCLILVLFPSDSFFFVRCMKYYQYYNHVENIVVPSVH